ncbi:MAG: membrane protein insertion efficiency factor YidD [Lentisphaeria bacterium]|nr:membrane protein insertion efficiency factor YidD [Lentisphaeria bacterium]
MKRRLSLINRLFLFFLWVYRRFISPLKPSCCRFTPTCSGYAREALIRHGFFKGGWLSFRRVMRCHPFYKGCLYDPVPGSGDATESSEKTDEI